MPVKWIVVWLILVLYEIEWGFPRKKTCWRLSVFDRDKLPFADEGNAAFFIKKNFLINEPKNWTTENKKMNSYNLFCMTICTPMKTKSGKTTPRGAFFYVWRLWLAMFFCMTAVVSGYTQERIIIDGAQKEGRIFDGVGGISAGGSSRLLIDYPEPERSQILDYLFKPNYGASLHILKVEIGGDIDATSGAEASHMRSPDDLNCNRGYEWWLINEAKARNPEIKLYALQWGAPGWFEGGYWSEDNIRYVIAWLDCAKSKGLTIDYLGGGNEMGHNKEYYIKLKKALDENGYEHIKVVASDNHHPPIYWQVATDMRNDAEFNAAIDIVGEHDVCHWQTLYKHCDVTEDALTLGKPLWNSEQSTEDYSDWAGGLARGMNRNYIDARVTANLNWGLISAFYGNFPCAGTGLILADQPWSGYYDLGKGIWVDAHTTQFAQPGWRYINTACGYLESGASYVTLRAPETNDYSTVIETMDAARADTVQIEISGGLSQEVVHVWSTNINSNDQNEHFVYVGEEQPDNGIFNLIIKPGHLYTLSTTTGQKKGTAQPSASRAELMPLPYNEDFEEAGETRLAKYFSDIHGAFEAVPCGGDRSGTCYRQVVEQNPIAWHGATMDPATIIGDPRWWGDYKISADVYLEGTSYVELLGRIESQMHNVAGYRLQVSDDNGWRLYTEDVYGKDTVLASGPQTINVGEWHKLALSFLGDEISAFLDGKQLGKVKSNHHTSGQAGLRVNAWQHAQFDNVEITKTANWPELLPQEEVTATASNSYPEHYKGYTFKPGKAVDGRVESMWRTQWKPPVSMPQSITLDLGSRHKLSGLIYHPQVGGGADGIITGYNVYVSRDGENFKKVVENGVWAKTIAAKKALWSKSGKVRYVRLEATESTGGYVSIGELNLILAD